MWHQCSAQGFQLHQPVAAEAEHNDQFLSFAKRSKEVHRQYERCVSLPPPVRHSPLPQYDHTLFERILQHPSEVSLDSNPTYGNQLNLFSSEPFKLDSTLATEVNTANLSLDNLPSPAELMGRKKKGGGRVLTGDSLERQAAAFTKHIRDLKRKQSLVDQMKQEKWRSSSFSYTPESSYALEREILTKSEDPVLPETPWSLGLAQPHPQYDVQSPAHLNSDVFNQEEPGGFRSLLDLAPGGNPMMSFVVTGTAHRGTQRDWDTPRLSHAEFWGFNFNTEE